MQFFTKRQSSYFLLSVLLISTIALVSCGDSQQVIDAEDAISVLKHSPRDPAIVNEIHESILAALPDYEKEPLAGLTLAQIEEIHTYFNIERWNKKGDIGTRGGTDYDKAAELFRIQVDKLKAADTYYHYKLMPKLKDLLKDFFKDDRELVFDYYTPFVETAYCGPRTLQGEILINGPASEEMKTAAAAIASRIQKEMPEWVTGFKLNNARYEDSTTGTKGVLNIGFLYRENDPIREMKPSETGFGWNKPTESDIWHNEEWNDRKMIPHPEYRFLKGAGGE